MASFIYFYSKFTEEFLLLSAAGIFTLLSIYCYHWVIKRRRLGAARNHVPAGVVKAYLNQLIDEAQFVRTQLFGLIANGENPENIAAFQGLFLKGQSAAQPSHPPSPSAAIPTDLLERLKALEAQLSEKESMVVNINVEKTKLLEEIEHLKQNEKAITSATTSSNNDDLVKKIKSLEERLEEYSLFEDDLANLKRLQQENAQLKKRLEEAGGSLASTEQEPAIEPTTASEPILKEPAPFALDQGAVDSLLEGVTPTPPTEVNSGDQASIEPEPVVAASTTAPTDEFEKLVDSVETSLDPLAAAPQAETTESIANKTDEELLKEFENLLNS